MVGKSLSVPCAGKDLYERTSEVLCGEVILDPSLKSHSQGLLMAVLEATFAAESVIPRSKPLK